MIMWHFSSNELLFKVPWSSKILLLFGFHISNKTECPKESNLFLSYLLLTLSNMVLLVIYVILARQGS